MTTLLARFDDWSDRLSPIMVKEIRQMVRAREFNYSLGASLVVGMLVAFIGLADAANATGTSGSRVFVALMVCLSLLGLVVIPLGAFSTLRNERADQTLELITQTTLSPRRIVVGKLLTQWVKLATLFAGLAPFITMSFLLGGIDLLTILIALTVLFMWSMWMCAASLFLSSASESRTMTAVFFVGMLIAFLWILATGAPLIFIAGAGIPSASSFSGIFWGLAASTALCFTSMANFVLLAENRLALAIEDRSTALRVGFLIQFLLIVACTVGPTIAGAPGYTKTGALEALGIFGGLHLTLTAVFAITEDMTLSRRVFRRIQKSLKRPWLALFRPGGGRGAQWILIQMVILLVAGLFTDTSQFRWLGAICCYILFFTGVPTAILRNLLPASKSKYLRAAILLFFPIAALSADILQYVLNPSNGIGGTFSAYHILNPFRALANWPEVESNGWQVRTLILGLLGLLAYLDLYWLGWREDKRAAAQN